MNKREVRDVIIGFVGVMLCTLAVILFNYYVLMSLPLILIMISMIVTYWFVALVPLIISNYRHDSFADYGFCKANVIIQVLTGMMIGLCMSIVLTLIPHIAGLGRFVDSGKRYKYLWQLTYEFLYCIVAVGAVEEIVFRGFFYKKLKSIYNKELPAIVISSLLFGFFHIFSGNIIQVFCTALIGAFFCFARLKISRCTTLSLIIAHGVYDAMIVVFSSVL